MTERAADQQGEARRNRTEPVSREASATAAAAFARAGFKDPTLVLRWDEIVGPEVARLARPIRLTEAASGGILTLKAEPAASLFLQHETRALAARINAYLGRAAIAKLKFVQGPLAVARRPAPLPHRPGPVPPADPARSYRGPDGLKAALMALARTRRRIPVD